jgi:hypothetical protein
MAAALILAAVIGAFAFGFTQNAFAQNPPAAPAVSAPKLTGDAAVAAEASKGVPPRATPADYQTAVKMGAYTLAAEFTGHSVPTPEAVFSTEDYVVVEVALFGPAGSHIVLSPQDFSLRINGKKMLLPAQPYGLVFHSLKDPEYVAPELADAKSKGSGNGLSTGGAGQGPAPPNLPPVVHIPIGIERAMQQKVQKAALPEGDRPLPVAGLTFFEHRGKSSSIELIYSGPAGKATIPLQ